MVKTTSKLETAARDPVISQIFKLVPEAKDEAVVDALLQDRALRDSLKISYATRVSFLVRLWSRIKAIAMVWILFTITLPVSLILVAIAMLTTVLGKRQSRISAGIRGTALVSGGNKGKALAMIRHLHRSGWRVVLVEVDTAWGCGTRFSNCVSAFYSTPRPNTDPVGYLKRIQEIAAKEKVNLWCPVSMAQYSVYESLAAYLMPPNTISCTTDPSTTAILNDKNVFTAYAKDHGVPVPEAFEITSKEQLYAYNKRSDELFKGKTFLLKSIAYAAISRADLFTLPCKPEVLENYIKTYEVSETQPWMLQQFLRGPEYSSYSLAYQGRVIAHVDNKASLSCLNYEHIGIKAIQKWVEDFCRKTNASGQLCFDFMYDRPGGKIYCIEANPRTSTNMMAFYNQPKFAHAIFEPQSFTKNGKVPVLPLSNSKQSYWFWNEIGEATFGQMSSIEGILSVPRKWQKTFKLLLNGRDAILDGEDPLPFLALHYLQEPLNLWRVIKNGTPWLKLDLCSGKVVEMGGD